ncbi:MAG: 4'-phosphopantetheinyl transferase superfamily protein [Pirellulales bacterium]|nr:4'-phosphopantetheinyl transferase superfamily protein [Pirellulales bacterium]
MSPDPRVVWRLACLDPMQRRFAEDTAAWLSSSECNTLATLGDAGRRRSWIEARILAKQLILECESIASSDDPRAIEVVSRDSEGRGRRPRVAIAGHLMPWCLSISHTDEAVAVVLCTSPNLSVGVDLVKRESLGPGFLRTWFDRSEQQWVIDEKVEVCRLWAVKEAVYKAMGLDDSFAPRRILIREVPGGGYTGVYRGVDLVDRCHVDTWPYEDHLVALATVEHPISHRVPVAPAIIQSSSLRR